MGGHAPHSIPALLLLAMVCWLACVQRSEATGGLNPWLVTSTSVVGTYFRGPSLLTSPVPGTSKRITLGCLDSVAPEPYNYKMRCPDTAQIYDYFDAFGAYHRRIVHAPLPGVTVRMAKWFVGPIIPLLSPLINCMGRKIEYWYKCWHPIDHIAVIPFPGASPDIPALPAIFLRVWEHYRKLPNDTVPDFELNMPLQVMDPSFNQVQIRVPFPIPGKGPGIIVGAFNSLYEDTPEGLRVTTEFIVGSDQPGINAPLNLVAASIISNQFYGLSDQLARHSVEEWGNLQYFLPELYAQYHPFGGPLGK